MMNFQSSPLSCLALFFLLLSSRQIGSGATPIQISNTLVTAQWNTTKTGQSTIVVEYLLDQATLGRSVDDKDFYVLQSLQDGRNCDNDFTDGYASLNGLTEPTISGTSQTTTTLVSMVDWPRGINFLCLRLQLMLQMSNNKDMLWHQVDFQFDVDVTFEEGSSNVILGGGSDSTSNGNGIVGSLPATSDPDVVIMDDGPSYPGVDPTFSISFLAQGPFPYGTEIPFLIEFHHPMDIFIYDVPLDKVVPVDGSNNRLMDPTSGQPITLRSVEFVITSADHATGIQGVLTITLPLIMFQMTSVSNVGIVIPVAWTNKSRRGRETPNLRRGLNPMTTDRSIDTTNNNNNITNEDDEFDSESSQKSWQTDAVIQLELLPYDHDPDSSGAVSHIRSQFDFTFITMLMMMLMMMMGMSLSLVVGDPWTLVSDLLL